MHRGLGVLVVKGHHVLVLIGNLRGNLPLAILQKMQSFIWEAPFHFAFFVVQQPRLAQLLLHQLRHSGQGVVSLDWSLRRPWRNRDGPPAVAAAELGHLLDQHAGLQALLRALCCTPPPKWPCRRKPRRTPPQWPRGAPWPCRTKPAGRHCLCGEQRGRPPSRRPPPGRFGTRRPGGSGPRWR